MSVYIGIPSYDGKLHHQCVAGLLQTSRLCGEKGIGICVEIIPHDAFVGRARSVIASNFLKTDMTDLLFVDADIGFKVEDVVELCRAAPDIVMGLYLMKSPQPRYPALMTDPLVRHPTDMRLIKMQYGPAGFMRIRRRVLEKMIEKFPMEFWLDGRIGKVHDFFPAGRFNNSFVGEDIKFCERAINCGFDIWAMQGISLQHVGFKTWDSTWQIDRLSVHDGEASPSKMGAVGGYDDGKSTEEITENGKVRLVA